VTLVIIPTIYASLSSIQERRKARKANNIVNTEPQFCPNNHLGLAILAIFLSTLVGIAAVINAVKVDKLWALGDKQGAVRKSKNVMTLFWTSLIITIVTFVVIIAQAFILF
jgi:hypothetical protein